MKKAQKLKINCSNWIWWVLTFVRDRIRKAHKRERPLSQRQNYQYWFLNCFSITIKLDWLNCCLWSIDRSLNTLSATRRIQRRACIDRCYSLTGVCLCACILQVFHTDFVLWILNFPSHHWILSSNTNEMEQTTQHNTITAIKRWTWWRRRWLRHNTRK